MVKFTSLLSLGLTFMAGFVSAQAAETTEAERAPANIQVTAQFPDNPFGMIVNGQRNQVMLELANKDASPYTLSAVSGQISKADDFSKVIRNLTSARFARVLDVGKTFQVPYSFYSEYAPGEHGLTVYIDFFHENSSVRVVGFNGTITVTDPESSWLDPQLLILYVILLAGGTGVAYIIREAFFPDTKKSKKTKKVEEPTERPTHRDEKGDMVLDQSWIPDHHLGLNSPKKTSPKIKKRASRK